jgi:hypothetical protein
MSGPFIKGALVGYPAATDFVPPTVTAFQFNPEKMVHTWSQEAPAGQPGVEAGNPMAIAGMPGETFQFTIWLDADDDALGPQFQLAQAALSSGVSGRLAALEMLLYPIASSRGAAQSTGGLLGTVSAAASALGSAVGGSTWEVPNSTAPVVLFVWGPQRIVPVRVTTLTITETLYDVLLNPTHAEADMSLRVLTPAELFAASPEPGTSAETAQIAYELMLARRRQWAATQAANAPSSIIGMLPQ